VFFQRNLVPADAGDGVSTYLALTFGTLLSSQGTVASFVLTLSGFPPGASLRSCVSDSIRSFRSDFLGAFQVPASAFPFPAVLTLSGPFGARFPVSRVCLRGCWAVPTCPTLARSLGVSKIEASAESIRSSSPNSN
jgi:hypothetical protein